MVKSIFLLIVFSLVSVVGGCKTGLDELRDLMGEYGYTLYEPPRSNHGPGWTFRMAKTFDGHVVPVTVCENLYPSVKTKNANVTFPNSQVESSVNIDFAVELLEGLIDNIGEAKANLKAKGAKGVTINWGGARAEELIPEQTFDKTGTKLEIDQGCSAHLSDLKKKGELSDSIFFVQQAVRVDKLDYKVTDESEKGGGLSLNIKELLTLKPDVKVSKKDKNTLSIEEPRYVGFRAFVITDVVPTGLLGPETAVVSGRELTKAEISNLLKN
jgi:hypothetical protein